MHLTKEQREAKQDRNERIRKDHTSGLTRKQLSRKYQLSPEAIYSICRYNVVTRSREERELTEGEQRIRDKYKNFDLAYEIGKSSPIRDYHFDYIARPKMKSNYSQVIFR